MSKLSHVDETGKANMVDVGSKKIVTRTAKAEGYIYLQPETVELIRDNKIKKGDVLTIAEVAGIQAGKKTSDLIPLCHPLQITKLDVTASVNDKGVYVQSFAKCIGQTGIEMEALTAVNVALLTVYDMCKAADKKMRIGNITLVEKHKSDEIK